MDNKDPESLFDFLTEPTRFETAAQVFDSLPAIRLQLIQDFWEPVIYEVETALTPKGWLKVDTDSIKNSQGRIFTERYGGFYFMHPNWEMAHVGVESLSNRAYYGVTFPGKKHGTDKSVFDKYLKEHHLQDGFVVSSPHWLMFAFFNGFDFSRMTDCVHILPANRGRLIEQTCKTVIDFCNKMETHLDVINSR
jgi:hypothetical protein